MADIAADLKDRFWIVECDLLEEWNMVGFPPDGKTNPALWTEAEDRAINILKPVADPLMPFRTNYCRQRNIFGKCPGDV